MADDEKRAARGKRQKPEGALPADPAEFYRAGPRIDVLSPPPPDARPALERLGSAPFRKGGFPLMGFLATLCEHVAAQAGGAGEGGRGGGTEQS